MTPFSNKIVRFDQPKTREFFPEKFSNEVYFSNVLDHSEFCYTSNFSIKYVIRGYENYKVGNRNFKIVENQYLLVNDQQTVWCNQAEAKAISIFVDKDVVQNVWDSLIYSEEQLLDRPFENRRTEVNFFENLYSGRDELNLFLNYFNKVQTSNQNFIINHELFYMISERLLQAQLKVRKMIDKIDTIKFSTRCELYRRTLLAKEYIEDNLTSGFNLDGLSRACGLSKYHLLRTFKTIYQTTPYNYYLRRKIEKSKILLQLDEFSISEIAFISGFNDVQSYSRRFKSICGISPATYRNSKLTRIAV